MRPDYRGVEADACGAGAGHAAASRFRATGITAYL